MEKNVLTPEQEIHLCERVAKVEERVDSGFKYVGVQLDDIKNNHLHSLHKDVGDLKIQVNSLTVKIGVAVSIVTIAIDLFFRFLFK